MTVPEIWPGQNRGRKKRKKKKKKKKKGKNERSQNHIASPTGIANDQFHKSFETRLAFTIQTVSELHSALGEGPHKSLPNTSKVQECCGWEFAAKLGEFDYSIPRHSLETKPKQVK